MEVNGYTIAPKADLTRADLRWAYLRWANLRGANLRWADLRWAYLRGADLYGADLTGASLHWANLTGANLTGASLQGASLQGAFLRGANLTGTCLDPASPKTTPSAAELRAEGFEVRGGWVYGWRTHQSQHVGDTVYEVGQTYTAPWFSTAPTPCHPGLYVATHTWLDQQGYPHPRVRVRFRRRDLHQAGDKYRVTTFTVVEG